MTQVIPFAAGEANLTWQGLTQSIEAGHRLPKAQVEDTFLYRGKDTLLSRAAWIDGMGLAVKSATVFPDNPAQGNPMVGGAVSLFNDSHGALDAVIDFHLVTKWKTAGDSLLAATKLARPDSRNILIVGAGTVGRSLYHAYASAFPDAKFTVWNRSSAGALAFQQDIPDVAVAADLEQAVRATDIITSATMSTDPLILGDWFQPGQHVDLIGAYRPDMRETDDTAITRARVFVDSRATTMEHIGELRIPLESGVILPEHVVADYYEMDRFERTSDAEITLFKNGGGAHMDLMVSRYILDSWLS
jgi:ornithine cyclodeaminase